MRIDETSQQNLLVGIHCEGFEDVIIPFDRAEIFYVKLNYAVFCQLWTVIKKDDIPTPELIDQTKPV